MDEGKFEIGTRRSQMLRSDVNEGHKNESTRPRALRETVFEKTNARSCRFQSPRLKLHGGHMFPPGLGHTIARGSD